MFLVRIVLEDDMVAHAVRPTLQQAKLAAEHIRSVITDSIDNIQVHWTDVDGYNSVLVAKHAEGGWARFADAPKLDPLMQFGYDVIAKDPVALDAAQDALGVQFSEER